MQQLKNRQNDGDMEKILKQKIKIKEIKSLKTKIAKLEVHIKELDTQLQSSE